MTVTNKSISHPVYWNAYVSSGGVQNPGYPQNGSTTVMETINRVSASVPGFRTKIARMQSATGGLSLIRDSVTVSNVSWRESYEHGASSPPTLIVKEGNGLLSYGISHLSITDPGFSEAIQGAKTAWFNKLQALEKGVLLGVTAGEAGESYRMIKDRGTKIGDKMSTYMQKTLRLRKGHGVGLHAIPRKGKLGAYLQDQNNLYLEYSYGWAPLVGEISAWAKEIETSAFRGYRDSTTLMSKRTIPVSAVGTVPVANLPVSFLVPLSWTVETTLKKSLKYYGLHLLETSVADRRITGVGLRPGDFVATVYELIPWSFVVDYFSNLGTVLNSLASKSARLAWSQTTEVTETRTRYTSPHFIPSGLDTSAKEYVRRRYSILGNYAVSVSGAFERTTIRVTRYGGTPTDMTPELELRMPSAHQGFNVLSLLTGKYRAFQKLL